MSITLNMTGGTSIKAYAHIIVSHDASATISCTNSKKIIPLSTGMTMILVSDNASSCVVTATTSGGVTNTRTVSITSGESYYILLYNKHSFVINGVIQGSSMTTDTRKDASASYGQIPTVTYATGYIEIVAGGSGTYNGAGTAYFPETVDLAKYTTLHVQGTAYNTTGENSFCSADVWSAIGASQADNRRVLKPLLSSSASSYTSFSVTADISTYTDSAAYIGFNFRRNNQGSSGVRLTEVWVD